VIGGLPVHPCRGLPNVVLKNALFLPVTKADYRVIPWATFTDPELARVGLTEQQARERHGDNIYVVKQDFAEVDRAQAEALTSGFAKIITRRNGQILGASGPAAGS